ncbi:hypothetical protein MMC07_009549 [Pseudocyphellaria aurata]|nr:hypothetical protein [Pseudocyphellaria aurata]
MEGVTGRLRELERMEFELLDERKRIVSQRMKEDRDVKENRASEDEDWAERLRRRDQEEAELRLRRRELGIISAPSNSINDSNSSEMATLSVSSQSKSSSISPKLSTRSSVTEANSVSLDLKPFSTSSDVKPLSGTHSNQSDGQPLNLVTLPTMQQHHPKRKRVGKNEVRQKRVEGSRVDDLRYRLPIAFDSTQEPLYVRPSDGKLVSLKCCIGGCKATGFSSVDSLIRHVRKSCIMSHNGDRRLLSTIKETIETCSHVVPGQEDEEPVKQPVGSDTSHSFSNPSSSFDELLQFPSSAPNEAAVRSDREKTDIKKEELVSQDQDEERDIQDTGLINNISTIPLTERHLQELRAREREKPILERKSDG